jgi:hypothetical protein
VDCYPRGTTHADADGDRPVGAAKKGKLCPGYIAGFVQFTQPLFPTPGRVANPDRTPAVDPDIYAVVRAATDCFNFDDKFVTRFRLLTGESAYWLIPMWALVGPLAVVPDLHTGEFRFSDEHDHFLAVKPYRQWGDHFGMSIERDDDVAEGDDDDDEEDGD